MSETNQAATNRGAAQSLVRALAEMMDELPTILKAALMAAMIANAVVWILVFALKGIIWLVR